MEKPRTLVRIKTRMTITIDMPRGQMTVHHPDCIGHTYIIAAGYEQFVATCIDADSQDRPKRMRTDNGTVFMPGAYRIVQEDPMLED